MLIHTLIASEGQYPIKSLEIRVQSNGKVSFNPSLMTDIGTYFTNPSVSYLCQEALNTRIVLYNIENYRKYIFSVQTLKDLREYLNVMQESNDFHNIEGTYWLVRDAFLFLIMHQLKSSLDDDARFELEQNCASSDSPNNA